MENKQPIMTFTFKKLMMLCFIAFFLGILNSCVPTFASVGDQHFFEEAENPIDEEPMSENDDVEEADDETETLEFDVPLPEVEEIDEPEEVEEEVWPERVAFLTFDDGPSWNTARLLDILYEEEVPATFFLLGASMINHPETIPLMERMLKEGHYIGLHSMTHVFATLYLGEGAANRFVDEMLQLQTLIYDSVGHQTNLCRAPYGMMSGFRSDSGHAEAIAEAGIKCIDWNIDPQDWNNSAELILTYVINQVEMLNAPAELVIVLHEHDQTVAALPSVIAYLREQGYVFKAYSPGHEFIYQQHRIH